MCPCVIRPVLALEHQQARGARARPAAPAQSARAAAGSRSRRRARAHRSGRAGRAPAPVHCDRAMDRDRPAQPDARARRRALGLAHAPGRARAAAAAVGRVRVVSRTGGIADGTRVTLAVPFGPVRLRWVSEHRDVDPPHGFADAQIEGPFAHWVHVHAMARGRPVGVDPRGPDRVRGPGRPGRPRGRPPRRRRRGCPRCCAIATRRWPPTSPPTPASPIGRVSPSASPARRVWSAPRSRTS